MALSALNESRGSVKNKARGSRTGTRVAADFTIELGFQPKYIKVTNLTDRVSGELWSVSPAGFQLLTIADGTRTYADAGISVGSNGTSFTVDVSVAGLETDNDDVVWEAHD